ncbi:hypothetical protein [Psychrobacter jeotgali]|uniref:hypothetical protein n=1 Tax=Psychrobacter jeotgali TaxID=179010 RepID=UPI001918A5C6|nr:hypothetical protein [Psychrobacter jeotgali]
MKQNNYKSNSWLNKSITPAIIGASFLITTPTYASKKSTSYDNTRYIIDKMSQASGSSINVKYNTRQSQLSTIKKYFDLSDEKLANLVGVSRKTLYNWEKQGISKQKDRQRVFELSVIAEDWNYNKLPTDKEKLFTPVLGSTSVMQMLTNKELDREKIIFAGRRLAHQSLTPEVGLI